MTKLHITLKYGRRMVEIAFKSDRLGTSFLVNIARKDLHYTVNHVLIMAGYVHFRYLQLNWIQYSVLLSFWSFAELLSIDFFTCINGGYFIITSNHCLTYLCI